MALVTRQIVLSSMLLLGAVQCGGSTHTRSNTAATEPSTNPSDEPTGVPVTPNATRSNAAESTMGSSHVDRTSMMDLRDPQIAAITDQINTAEIEQARVAQAKASDDQVRQFAGMIMTNHGEAKTQQAMLGLSSAESAMSQQLEQRSRATLEMLRATSGPEFDRAYIQAQVEEHRDALNTIERQLLPNVQDPELRAYLENLAPKIEAHLQHALSLQQSLQARGASPTGAAAGMR